MRHLAIGSGAMGFFMYLGVIAKLKRAGRLDDLEEISGASAGAVLGFLFCATKGDPTKSLDYALNVPVKQLMRPNIKSLLRDYGIVPTSKVRKILAEACRKFFGKDDVSFQELHEWHPIKFHVSAYCVDLMKTVYFSIDTTPTMSVLDAICASVAIPFVFSSVKLADGWNYIDGGSAESIPGGPFLGRLDVLALRLGWNGTKTEVKDLKSYALNILYSTMKLRYGYDYPTLELNIPDGAAFDFSASNEGKIRLFLMGYEQAR
jgi:predicted acylesterase/phospholipase RssA